jgi:hypothetical protein
VNIENKIETKPKEGLKEKIIGGIILLVVIIVVIVLKINSIVHLELQKNNS